MPEAMASGIVTEEMGEKRRKGLIKGRGGGPFVIRRLQPTGCCTGCCRLLLLRAARRQGREREEKTAARQKHDEQQQAQGEELQLQPRRGGRVV